MKTIKTSTQVVHYDIQPITKAAGFAEDGFLVTPVLMRGNNPSSVGGAVFIAGNIDKISKASKTEAAKEKSTTK